MAVRKRVGILQWRVKARRISLISIGYVSLGPYEARKHIWELFEKTVLLITFACCSGSSSAEDGILEMAGGKEKRPNSSPT